MATKAVSFGMKMRGWIREKPDYVFSLTMAGLAAFVVYPLAWYKKRVLNNPWEMVKYKKVYTVIRSDEIDSEKPEGYYN